MIQSASLLWVGIVLSCRGGPYLQTLVPLGYQYMRLILKLGSTTIMKEYMGLTMKLIPTYFNANEERLAQQASDVAIKILREGVQRKRRGKRRSGAMLGTVSTSLVGGLERMTRSGLDNRLDIVLDCGIRLFQGAVGRKQTTEATDLSGAWMLLLTIAIQSPGSNGSHSPILDRLLTSWVTALHRTTEQYQASVETVLDSTAEDINKLAREGQDACAKLVKAWMEVLRVAIRERRKEVSKMVSKSLVRALYQSIAEGHRETINNALRDATNSMYLAIRDGDEDRADDISDARQRLLIAATESNSSQLAAMLSETFLVTLDRAMEEDELGMVNNLTNRMATGFRSEVTRNAAADNPIWAVTIELLATTTRVGSQRLVESVFKAYVSELEAVRTRFGGFVEGLSKQSTVALRKAINTHDRARADALVKSAFMLLLSAINQHQRPLARDLSNAWIAALEAVETQERMRSLTEVGTEAFRAALEGGGAERTYSARTLAAAGLELLCAAVRYRKWGVARLLSRTWVRPLADVIEKGQVRRFDAFINALNELFDNAVNGGDIDEAEATLSVALEFVAAAVSESREVLINRLSREFTQRLEDMRREDDRVVGRLVVSVRERFNNAVSLGDTDEVRVLSVSARRILRAAEEVPLQTLAKFIRDSEAWSPLLQRPLAR
jgi:hypothetical protein